MRNCPHEPHISLSKIGSALYYIVLTEFIECNYMKLLNFHGHQRKMKNNLRNSMESGAGSVDIATL